MTKAQLAHDVLKQIKAFHQTPKGQIGVLDEIRGIIEDERVARIQALQDEMNELKKGMEPEIAEPNGR